MIPGLIDSHLHAVRAALSFTSEVNWIGARSLPEAMARIGAAARSREPGAWLIVAGGWNELQFAERRRPTQAELEAAAPDNPVYVQLGYGWALLTDAGLAKLGIRSDADLPAGGKLERDAAGKSTGAITGGKARSSRCSTGCRGRRSTQQVDGTKAFFRELNRLGLTGVVDPGGNNLFPSDYQALFEVWRRRRDDGARRVQLERPDRRARSSRSSRAHGAFADGLRRRLAAVQRSRRADHGSR